MTYKECIDIISSRSRFGIKPGLSRIKLALQKLGNPQDKLKFIHVAGTNGKGSTCNMISSIIIEAGYKTGLFTSPFVVDFRDRIKINHQMIPKKYLCKILESVNNVTKNLTEFELITVIALKWFQIEKCDIVVLEVGLGGRLDATNIIKTPLVSVITAISLDHTSVLGDSIEKIAYEKCGIIKKDSTVITYPDQHLPVLNIINKVARDNNNALIIPELSLTKHVKYSIDGSIFSYKNKVIELRMMGRHQIKNCITAIEVVDFLKESGLNISYDNIFNGIKKTKVDARLEILCKDPLIILDGSHNVDSINALLDVIDTLFNKKTLIGIIGVLKDKDYQTMIKNIIPKFSCVYTITPKSIRALPSNILKNEVEKYCSDVKSITYISQALKISLKKYNKNSAIVIFGSLYIANDAKKLKSFTDLSID